MAQLACYNRAPFKFSVVFLFPLAQGICLRSPGAEPENQEEK
jgi:hypothetical protein